MTASSGARTPDPSPGAAPAPLAPGLHEHPLPSGARGPWGRCVALLLAPVRPLADPHADVLSVVLYPFMVLALAVDALLPGQRATLRGPVLRTRRGLRRREVDLSAATAIRLDSHAAMDVGVWLVADAPGTRVVLPLLTDAVAHRRHQPAWVLRHLAEALRTNPRVDTREVVELLERQADHLDAGGHHRESPLRPLAHGSHTVVPASPPGGTSRSLRRE